MIAIVTGASSGIGKEFCRSLDAETLDSIWLISRGADRLEAIASELSTPCRIIPTDLTDRDQRDSLMDLIRTEAPEIGWLINCAGMGRFGNSADIPLDELRSTMELNMNALVEMSCVCVPFMKKGSHIVQVCSASAYMPLEGLNVYSSSKSFVRSFTRVLRNEIKDSGISVTEVSPGWVETDFIALSQQTGSVPAKVFKHTVTAEDVAKTAMAAARKGKDRSICGTYNKFQVFMCRHFTPIAQAIWRRSLH